MKVILLLVICCGAVLSAGNSFGDAINLVHHNLITLSTDLFSTLQNVPKATHIADVAGSIIHFTNSCVIVVIGEATINIAKEDMQSPTAIYSEINDVMKLLPGASDALITELTKLSARGDNITASDTEEIANKCNLIHSIFNKSLTIMLSSEHNEAIFNMSMKLIEWGDIPEKLQAAIATLSNIDDPEYIDYANELRRLAQQLSSIEPNILGIEKLVAFEVANKGDHRPYFLQLSPVYIVDMYYEFVCELEEIAKRLEEGKAEISTGYLDNIKKGCAVIENMKSFLTATIETCEDFNTNGQCKGDCIANLGYLVGKIYLFDGVMASLRTFNRLD